MKEAWKRNLAKLEEFPAMCGCFRFPAFAGFCCQSWFGFGGWTDTQISSDLSEGWRQKLGCLKQDVNGLFAGVPVDAAYLQASLRFSCWHSLRPPHVLGNERCGRFDTPATTMADVRVQWRHILIKPYDKNNQCMLESKWSGLKLQLEGTIDHLVSSVKMKDGIPLLSSTAGENMKETCVTWPRRKKRKSKAKKKAPNDKWHVILSHFWPCCSLTCSTTATNVFHGEPSADWLATEGSVTRRETCADVRKTSSPSSSLLLMFRSSWLSSVSGTDSPKAFFAAVFIGMHAHEHCLSAWVDYRSILN